MLRRLRYLFPYYRRYRLRFAFGVLAILLAAVVGLVSPLLVGQAVDVLREDLTRRALLVYAGLLVLVELVRGVFTFTQRVVLVTMSRNIERDLRDRYFEHLTRQEQRFYQDRATGDLMARATKDLEAVRMLCGPAIMYASNTVFTATGALSFMVWLDPGLTLVALSTLPLVVVTTKVLGAKVHELFESVQASYGDLSTRMQENLAGVRVVRAYAQEAGETEQFRQENERYVEHNRRLIHWSAAFRPALQALVGIAFAAVLWRGGLLVAEGTMSVGDFVAFLLLLGKLIWPMIAIGFVINLIERGTASLGRIRNVLEREPEIVDPAASGAGEEAPAAVAEGAESAEDEGVPAAAPAGFETSPASSAASEAPSAPPALGSAALVLEGAIRARHLDYAYPGEGETRVLHDVDFSVPAGTTVALVGRTGAGKSTLLSLVPRLLDPPPGHLFVDGHDVVDVPLATLRGAIAMVPQETFLFSTTVRENIALGRPDAPDEEISAAARHAGLSADLEGFPQGLDTLVGERGITLSGGQKQRVALARALLREPRILLLDDCLSAVDTRTEEEILGHLRRLFVGRTVFLVSHRISTVRDSDLILVLDHGRIVERGTHDELLALGGLYADLHERQLLEEELAVV